MREIRVRYDHEGVWSASSSDPAEGYVSGSAQVVLGTLGEWLDAKAAPLTTDERAELELLRDLRARVIGFGGDDYALMPWVDAHRHHADEPYIGCPFCRHRFAVVDAAALSKEETPPCR